MPFSCKNAVNTNYFQVNHLFWHTGIFLNVKSSVSIVCATSYRLDCNSPVHELHMNDFLYSSIVNLQSRSIMNWLSLFLSTNQWDLTAITSLVRLLINWIAIVAGGVCIIWQIYTTHLLYLKILSHWRTHRINVRELKLRHFLVMFVRI
jgi:hypothetical protein